MDAAAVSPQVATAGSSATRSSKRVRAEQPSPPKTNAFSDHELRTLGAGGAGGQRTKEESSAAWVLVLKAQVDAALKTYAHNCTANWAAGSKAMEAAEAVAMCLRAPKRGARISLIAMDDDASTRAHVRSYGKESELPAVLGDAYVVSDPGHRTKLYGRVCYALAAIKANGIAKEHAAYFKRMYGVILKTVGRSKTTTIPDLRKAMTTGLMEHAFGEHTNCGEWCKADSAGYLPPRGHFLPPAKKELFLDKFNAFMTDSMLLESIHGFDSNGNESFNSRMAHKAPKDRCYSQTKSLDARVASAVGEHNAGAFKFHEAVTGLSDLASVSTQSTH